jgi:hypothetical protein
MRKARYLFLLKNVLLVDVSHSMVAAYFVDGSHLNKIN